MGWSNDLFTVRVQLHSVTQAPHLGILIDNELKFNAHVVILIKKVNFQLLTLKGMSCYMDARTKLTIFKSFIASNFSYCCHIWYFYSPTLKTRLEKIQYRGPGGPLLRYVLTCVYTNSQKKVPLSE